jgi:putative endonuclease
VTISSLLSHTRAPGRPSVARVSTDPRRNLGEHGERLAAAHLKARGYELLDKNFRTRFGELDLVARHGRTLVFCEVKTRMAPDPFGPLVSVGPRKRKQLRRMAGQWLNEHGGRSATSDARFDVIGLTVDRSGRVLALEHLEGAF